MKPALVHLHPRQKARLTARARQRGNSFSQEVREALDFYLDIPPQQHEQLGMLAREVSRAADRMLVQLDDAIAVVGRVLHRMDKK
jgi:hypothetical protein